MILLATPDFGSSGAILVVLLLAWAVVLSLVAGGIFWAVRLLKSGSPVRRGYGVFLLLVSGLAPLCCCLGPPHVFRQEYGSYPVTFDAWRKVNPGMTAEEVTAAVGPPHARRGEGEDERWVYYMDSFEIHWVAIAFGPDGRVLRTYGN
jgi:hypothetical protein